jgi:hypothetical protein
MTGGEPVSEKQASEVEDAVGNDEPEQPPTSAPMADDDEPGDEGEGVGPDELEAEGQEDE